LAFGDEALDSKRSQWRPAQAAHEPDHLAHDRHERERLRHLEEENRQLRRANARLSAAWDFFVEGARPERRR
jgi:hypothetical protein